MCKIEEDIAIERKAAGHPSRQRIQKAYARFIATEGKLTGRRSVSRSRKGTRYNNPGLAAIGRAEDGHCLCTCKINLLREHPAMPGIDEGDLVNRTDLLDGRILPGLTAIGCAEDEYGCRPTSIGLGYCYPGDGKREEICHDFLLACSDRISRCDILPMNSSVSGADDMA